MDHSLAWRSLVHLQNRSLSPVAEVHEVVIHRQAERMHDASAANASDVTSVQCAVEHCVELRVHPPEALVFGVDGEAVRPADFAVADRGCVGAVQLCARDASSTPASRPLGPEEGSTEGKDDNGARLAEF